MIWIFFNRRFNPKPFLIHKNLVGKLRYPNSGANRSKKCLGSRASPVTQLVELRGEHGPSSFREKGWGARLRARGERVAPTRCRGADQGVGSGRARPRFLRAIGGAELSTDISLFHYAIMIL